MFAAQSSLGTLIFILVVTALMLGSGVATHSSLAQGDPIPGYLAQVDSANLEAVATDLVTLYGPRQEETYSPFADDQCTINSAIVYPKSTLEMSTDYAVSLFEEMGYSPAETTLEQVPAGAGSNVIVTKVGDTYPNVFIEFSAHIDSVVATPGGNDNASGSTAVIELARVLKDYPSRYSMRFILWVGEEFDVDRGTAYFGSAYHVQQLIASGEQIKAGLVLDHIGWPYPSDPTGLLNGVSYNNAESERIADMFEQVSLQYGIEIGFDKVNQVFNSDEHSYWDQGFTAVSSGGGWLYYRPEYHDCGDTADNIDFTNVLRTTQQNLAVGLKLDAEDYNPTGTPVPTSTPTNTATATPTNTPGGPTTTPTSTSTSAAPSGFPSTGILDNFERADGALDDNWGGATDGYGLLSNRMDVGSGDAVLWSQTSFGPEQEIFVTLTGVDAAGSEHDLLLKSQSATTAADGVLEVWYDPVNGRVQVWTYSPNQNWVQRGDDISVTFENGDQFGARARADGQVEVYRNGQLLATRDYSEWDYAASGGYIGFWFINSSNATLDDFGGGTVSAVPPTPTPTGTATNTPLPPKPTPTGTATNTPLPPTPTGTVTNTPLPATPTPTATATSTPLPATPTSTATATNTPLPATPTSTATATNTPLPESPTPPSGFPATNVLDSFDRDNGALGDNWGGATAGYDIISDQMDVGTGDAVLWTQGPFGPEQEIFVTFNKVDGGGTEHDLLLKSQSAGTAFDGVLEVWYDAANQRVQVWTYSPDQNWVLRGADIAVTFEDGDQFGARAKADGTVEVYRNGTLLGTRDASEWDFAASGGYIGLWFINSDNAILDDLGGGTLTGGLTNASVSRLDLTQNGETGRSDSQSRDVDDQKFETSKIYLPIMASR